MFYISSFHFGIIIFVFYLYCTLGLDIVLFYQKIRMPLEGKKIINLEYINDKLLFQNYFLFISNQILIIDQLVKKNENLFFFVFLLHLINVIAFSDKLSI